MKRSQITFLVVLQVAAILFVVMALTQKTTFWYIAAYMSAMSLAIAVAVFLYQYLFRSE